MKHGESMLPSACFYKAHSLAFASRVRAVDFGAERLRQVRHSKGGSQRGLSFAAATRSKKIEHVQRSSESNRRHMHTKKRRWNHIQNCKMCFVRMFFVAKFYLKRHQHDVQNLKARQLQQQPVAQRLLIRRKDRISNQEYPKKLARVVTLVPMKSRNTTIKLPKNGTQTSQKLPSYTFHYQAYGSMGFREVGSSQKRTCRVTKGLAHRIAVLLIVC